MLKTPSRARIGNYSYAVVTEAKPRTVECPSCKAKPQRLCTYVRGIRAGELYMRGKQLHKSREEAYYKQANCA